MLLKSKQVEQLTEQGDYLQKEMASRNKHIAMLEMQLKEIQDDQVY